ncbi:hypothetical protein AMECASPLE_016879, partial [Ameca splendens]
LFTPSWGFLLNPPPVKIGICCCPCESSSWKRNLSTTLLPGTSDRSNRFRAGSYHRLEPASPPGGSIVFRKPVS